MGDLRAKVAYLEGLAEGLGLDTESREGRLMAGIIDVMGEIAEAVEDVSDAQVDLADYVQEVEEDLNEVLEDADDVDQDDEDVALLCCPSCGSDLSLNQGEIDVQTTNSAGSSLSYD